MAFESDPTYPLFPVFAFLGFALVIVPLPWHLQAWNAGTCLYMIWAAIGCLNQFVNSVVWHGNALNPAPVWCDISIRLITGTSVAIPAASLCINRRLYKIATAQTFTNTRGDKRRAVIEDLAIGLGIPLIEMVFLYLVSGHRFNILEDIGCYPAIINTWLAYLLVGTWPIIIGLISAVYCILSLRAFYKRQQQFNELLRSNTSLTMTRYFRLMALATTELFCTTPLASYSIYLNLTNQPLTPYRGFADLHFDFSRVDQIPSTLWRLDKQNEISVELSRWLIVACALVFFMFFGFADEARRQYKSLFERIAKRLGIRLEMPRFLHRRPTMLPLSLSEKKKSNHSNGVLPIFVARPKPVISRDSILSFMQSESNEKLVRSASASAPSTRLSSSSITLNLPPISKTISRTDSSGADSPYAECYGHAY